MPWIEPMTWLEIRSGPMVTWLSCTEAAFTCRAYVLLAVFVYAFLSPGWREHCKQLHWQWAGAVVARNMAICTCGQGRFESCCFLSAGSDIMCTVNLG
eukprot:SAG31_NODE_370_length_16651_cov_3.511056_2_plen_98_part_00